MEHLLFKATLAAAVLTFLIILFTRKENSYLSAAGGDTKKLMVVDQTTGAITFLNNSVQGINDQFTNSDATQTALLKTLFGPNLDGEGGTFKAKLDAAVLPQAKRTLLDNLEKAWDGFSKGSSGADMRVDLKGKIPFGWGIQIEASSDGKFKDGSSRYLYDDQCDNNYSGTEKARWCSSIPVKNTMRIKASDYQPAA
tara:strand:+ start:643 stop:1233 length:591 start_codon:yes stop_codon:yes gene_type:complete